MLPKAWPLLLLLCCVAAYDKTEWNNQQWNDNINRNPNYGNDFQQSYNNDRANSGYNSNPGYNTNTNTRSYEKADRAPKSIFCYINGTRLSRPYSFNSQIFTMEDINMDLCTHVVFATTEIQENGVIQESPEASNSFEQLKNKKNQQTYRRHKVKLFASIGGNPSSFSRVLGDVQSHRTFVEHVRNLLTHHGLDGVVIDWRWPTKHNNDKEHLTSLLRDLKIALRGDAKEVAVTLPASSQMVTDGYELTPNIDNADFFIIMATDMYGHWSHYIGANAPITGRGEDLTKLIREIKQRMIPDHTFEFILAIPFHGKRYQMNNALSENVSPIGKDVVNRHIKTEPLTLSYSEICSKMGQDPNWRKGWDDRAQCPYYVNNQMAIIFDDTESVRIKTDLAIREGFGGVMAYSIDMDDFTGKCSMNRRYLSTDNRNQYNTRMDTYSDKKFPLLQSIYDTVQRGTNSAGIQSSPFALVFAIFAVYLIKFNN